MYEVCIFMQIIFPGVLALAIIHFLVQVSYLDSFRQLRKSYKTFLPLSSVITKELGALQEAQVTLV